MNKLRENQLTPFLVRIGSILLIFYVLFLLGRSVWVNYDLRQSIKKLNDQIATLEQEKKQLNDLNLYYGSQSFKELEARRKLGFKKPDEKIVIIASVESSNNFEQELNADRNKVAKKSTDESTSNWLLWLDYFTGPAEK